MITNFSKIDYYRSRNIPLPKPCVKLAAEVPARRHLIDNLPSYTLQVQRILQNQNSEHDASLEVAHLLKLLHSMEEKVAEINQKNTLLDEEAIEANSKEQNYKRRINALEKDCLRLKDGIQKQEYEFRSTMEVDQKDYQARCLNYERKIQELQNRIDSLKEEKDREVDEIRKSHSFYLEARDIETQKAKGVRQENADFLKGELEKAMADNAKFRKELITIQNRHTKVVDEFLKENLQLKQDINVLNSKIEHERALALGEIDMLKIKIQELELARKVASDKLLQERRQNQLSLQQVEDLRKQDKERWHLEYNQINTQNEELRRQLKAKILALENKEAENSKLLSQINQLGFSIKLEKEKAIENIEALEKQYAKLQSNIESVQTTAKFLDSELREKNKSILRMENELSVKSKLLLENEELLQTLSKQRGNSENHHKGIENQNKQLRSEITHLEEELAALRDKSRKNNEAFDKQRKEFQTLLDQNINKQRDKLDKNYNQMMEDASNSYKKRINEMKERVKQAEMETQKVAQQAARKKTAEKQEHHHHIEVINVQYEQKLKNTTNEASDSNQEIAALKQKLKDIQLSLNSKEESINKVLAELEVCNKQLKRVEGEKVEIFKAKVTDQEGLLSRITQQNENCMKLQKKRDELEIELNIMKNKGHTLHSINQQLEKQLKLCEGEIQQLKGAITTDKNDQASYYQHLKQQYGVLQLKWETILNDKEKGFTEIITQKDHMILQLRNEIQGHKKAGTQLQKDNQRLALVEVERNSQIKALMIDLDQLKLKQVAKKSEAERDKEDFQKMQQKLQQLISEKKVMTQKVHISQSEFTKLENRLKSGMQQQKYSEGLLGEKEQAIKALNEKLRQKENQIAELNDIKFRMEAAAKKQESETQFLFDKKDSKVEQEKQQLMTFLTEKQEELKRVSSDCDRKQESFRHLNGQLETKNRQILELQSKLEDIRKEAEKLRNENLKMKNQLAEKDGKIQELLTENRNLKEKADDLDKKFNSEKLNGNNFQTQMNNLRMQLESTTFENKRLNDEKNALQIEKQRLLLKVEEIEKKTTQLIEQIKKKSKESAEKGEKKTAEQINGYQQTIKNLEKDADKERRENQKSRQEFIKRNQEFEVIIATKIEEYNTLKIKYSSAEKELAAFKLKWKMIVGDMDNQVNNLHIGEGTTVTEVHKRDQLTQLKFDPGNKQNDKCTPRYRYAASTEYENSSNPDFTKRKEYPCKDFDDKSQSKNQSDDLESMRFSFKDDSESNK